MPVAGSGCGSGSLLATVNTAVRALLTAGETRDRIVEQGAEISAGTPEQFALFIKQEIAKWGRVVKAAGIRPE